MRQPPSGGDQLFQPGALIALEQLDERMPMFVPSRRHRLCWRGRCAPGRRHICCGCLRFQQIPRSYRRNGRAGYGLRATLIRPESFRPYDINFNEYAGPVSSSRRRIKIPSDFRFDSRSRGRPSEAWPPIFCITASYQGLRREDRGSDALRFDASNKIARCVSVSLAGELHRDHPLEVGGAVAVTTASPEPATSRAGQEFADHLIGGSLLQAPERP